MSDTGVGGGPRSHQTAVGHHQQGRFTDPFGHRWSVGDPTPLA